ncbi:MAG: hypothetical protein IJ383_00415 [Bacteroidales bacterium]|nr:hypothetical protein [Bacteroidales bacterium]
MMKKVLFWILSIVITLGASVYQRMTGPTNPKYVEVSIEGKGYKFKLPRSGGETDCSVVLKGFGSQQMMDSLGMSIDAVLHWRKYPTSDNYTAVKMMPAPDGLTAFLPAQPQAGKLEYYIELETFRKDGEQALKTRSMLCYDEPLIIRFKGDVPAGVLIPHILCMFISMLFGAYAFLCALANMPQYRRYTVWSFVLLVLGGFVLGPIVQKYAFDVYWSGFPFGSDLTDNKTLFAGVALLAAILTGKKSWNRWVVVLAMVVMFVIFSIPHSMRGSQLNHETGVIESAR